MLIWVIVSIVCPVKATFSVDYCHQWNHFPFYAQGSCWRHNLVPKSLLVIRRVGSSLVFIQGCFWWLLMEMALKKGRRLSRKWLVVCCEDTTSCCKGRGENLKNDSDDTVFFVGGGGGPLFTMVLASDACANDPVRLAQWVPYGSSPVKSTLGLFIKKLSSILMRHVWKGNCDAFKGDLGRIWRPK